MTVSPADNRRRAARSLGVLRVAAGPPLATAALLGVSSPTATVAVITLVVAMAGWQAVALCWVLSDRWSSFPTRAAAHVDMTLVGVLVGLSGGSGSPMLTAVAVLPLTFLLIGGPSVQLLLTANLAVAILLGAVVDTAGSTALLVAMLMLAWTAAIGLLAGLGRVRLEQRAETLEQERRSMLRLSILAQSSERAVIARHLHDDSLQFILAAAQELDDLRPENPTALDHATHDVAEALRGLRSGVDELHVSTSAAGRLGPALASVAERGRRLGGFDTEVTIDSLTPDRHADLLVGVARELVTNAAKHARASLLRITVGRSEPGGVRLEVADDGVGIGGLRPQAAVEAGHIGLLSCRERVEAVGGRLELQSRAGQGTRVVVLLP